MKIFDIHGVLLGEGESFAGAMLENANLEGRNLSKMDFTGANLYGAILLGANLNNANFAGALLLGADLTQSSALGTNFAGADFGSDNHGNGTTLAGMTYDKDTGFSGAFYDEKTIIPHGLLPNEHQMQCVSNVTLTPEDCEALQNGDLSKLMELLGRG